MYYKAFRRMKLDDYIKELNRIVKSDDKIIEQYAREVFDIMEHSLKIKHRLAHCASFTLTTGLILGTIILIAF